jgi:ABC-2 type transport system ATP-binding protein
MIIEESRLPISSTIAGAPTLVSSEPLRLLATHVTKRWRRDDPPLLDGLDLQIESSTLTAIVGRNGVGKTTLLRILAGLIDPTSGTIRLDGLDPVAQRREYCRRLGFLSAGPAGLYARLSVREHFEYWLRLALVRSRERLPRIEDALDRFELRALATNRVDRLSMGQRQRVRLALTFLHRPKLVLLDEPCASLDDTGRELVARVLTEFRAGGGSALVCLPAGEEFEQSDDVFRLESGRLVGP